MRLILLGGYFFGKMWKNMENRLFSRPDWGNTTWAAMAGLGSIGAATCSQLIWENLYIAGKCCSILAAASGYEMTSSLTRSRVPFFCGYLQFSQSVLRVKYKKDISDHAQLNPIMKTHPCCSYLYHNRFVMKY